MQAYLEAQTSLEENEPALKTLMARLEPKEVAAPPAVPGCYARPPKKEPGP